MRVPPSASASVMVMRKLGAMCSKTIRSSFTISAKTLFEHLCRRSMYQGCPRLAFGPEQEDGKQADADEHGLEDAIPCHEVVEGKDVQEFLSCMSWYSF